MARRPSRDAARVRVLAVIPALLLAGCSAPDAPEPRAPADAPPVGLFTTLPILWRETADFGDLLDSGAPPHWALAVITGVGPVRGLDTLADDDGDMPLPGNALLVLAQPRPLSPRENVALDNWVRAGGHVLLFADPLLTGHSVYPLGDRRRPQDVVLLSPILARWGLELVFDDAQAAGERRAAVFGVALPVNLPGRFRVANGRGGCTLEAGGLAAACRVGRGHVVAVADAALFDREREDAAGEEERSLRGLMDRAAPRD